MSIELSTFDILFFRQKRQDIALLYDLYFDYVSSRISSEKYIIPDSFTIIAAFSCVFDSDFRLVSGLCGFVPAYTQTGKVILRFFPHHWLAWKDDDHIIDVIPLDGMFGVSVPQAIIQKRQMRRYFPSVGIFPYNWAKQKKVEFDGQVNNLVTVLEELMQKVPL